VTCGALLLLLACCVLALVVPASALARQGEDAEKDAKFIEEKVTTAKLREWAKEIPQKAMVDLRERVNVDTLKYVPQDKKITYRLFQGKEAMPDDKKTLGKHLADWLVQNKKLLTGVTAFNNWWGRIEVAPESEEVGPQPQVVPDASHCPPVILPPRCPPVVVCPPVVTIVPYGSHHHHGHAQVVTHSAPMHHHHHPHHHHSHAPVIIHSAPVMEQHHQHHQHHHHHQHHAPVTYSSPTSYTFTHSAPVMQHHSAPVNHHAGPVTHCAPSVIVIVIPPSHATQHGR